MATAGDDTSLNARVLHGARKLFFERGYYATNTRDIAKAAGTSESGVFRVYESKYAVLMAVYNDCWRSVNASVEVELEKLPDDPRNKVLSIVKTVWKLYEDDPLTMSFIIMNTGNTDTLIIDRREVAIISDENIKYIQRIEILCREIQGSKLTPPGVTSRGVCEAVLGIQEGVLLGWYLADHASDRYLSKLSYREAVKVLSHLIYGWSNKG